MAVKAEYLLTGLSIFLILAIICTIVLTMNTPQKEQKMAEPVIMALVEDSRMLQSLPQPAAEPPKIQVKTIPARVSIPTDAGIDQAIRIVSRNAKENFANEEYENETYEDYEKDTYENFAVTSAPATQAPSLSAAQAAIDAKNKLDKAMSYTDPNASRSDNKGHSGDDINCYKDGSDPEFCANLCHKDPNCRGYNYVKPQGSGEWAKGGCCYKKNAIPLGSIPGVIFYTVTPSSAPGATDAQKAAQSEIDLAAAKAAAAKKAIEDQQAAAVAAAAKAAAAKAKAENDARIAKTINGYRGYKDATSTKYPGYKVQDPAAIDTTNFAFAKGGDNDANGPDVCSAKCNEDPSCRGFHYLTRPNDVHFKGTGGCQYFKHTGIATYRPGMTTPQTDVKRTLDSTADAYVITPNATGTLAQKGFSNDIADVQKTIDLYNSYNTYTTPQYTKDSGKDIGGSDIGKVVGGSPDQCRVKCDADPKCQGFNYVHNTAPGHPAGTCYYKTKAAPLGINRYVDFFTKIPLPPVPTSMAASMSSANPVVPAAAPASAASVATNAGTVKK
jgi:hypothetical protein